MECPPSRDTRLRSMPKLSMIQYCRRALISQYFYKVGTARATFHAIFLKNFWAICNLKLALRFREGAVNAACGFCAVASEKGAFVNHAYFNTMFHNSVGSRQTTQATTNDDYLVHVFKLCS